MSEADFQSPQNPAISLRVPANAVMPLFYFNGFVLKYGTGDFTLALKVDENVQLMLKTSYTVGKTLSQALQKLIEEFENITSHEIMTSHEVKDFITSPQEEHATPRSGKSAT